MADPSSPRKSPPLLPTLGMLLQHCCTVLTVPKCPLIFSCRRETAVPRAVTVLNGSCPTVWPLFYLHYENDPCLEFLNIFLTLTLFPCVRTFLFPRNSAQEQGVNPLFSNEALVKVSLSTLHLSLPWALWVHTDSAPTLPSLRTCINSFSFVAG